MANATQTRDFRIRLKAARQGAGFTPADLADELEVKIKAKLGIGVPLADEIDSIVVPDVVPIDL